MQVVRTKAGDLPTDIISRINSGPFMSSVGFARVWESVGGRAVYWTFQENNEIVAAFPGVEFGQGPLMRFQSMPDGCYGAPLILADTNDRASVIHALVKGVADAGYLKTYLIDFSSTLGALDGFAATEVSTLIVDGLDSDWQPPDKKLQSELRKAEREGINIERFDRTRHFAGLISLVKATESRHGRSPRYPPVYYEALAKLAEQDDRVVWLHVEHEKQAAASHIYFIEGDQLLHWQAYFDKKFSFLKPNPALMSAAIEVAVQRGITKLNMGATPLDAASLAAYKEKWGGHEYRYLCYEKRSWLGRWL